MASISSDTRWIAKFPFLYAGTLLDRGEVISLKNTPRDAQLIGLGYFVRFDPAEHREFVCDQCSRHFVHERARYAHKQKPTCLSDQREIAGITKSETAELLDTDVSRLVIDDEKPVNPRIS